ncbi:MAG TPA: protein kinase [Bacteroidota bacterium]|jgi:serine/threonine protein kinase|nr:protein kinase [Bacteroidota bacterium]
MIGQTISHYKILEKLGEGGMGVVYKAQDTKLDRTVAIKFLPLHLSASEENKTRFIQEAKSTAALNHPNILHVHEIDEENGNSFFVMEFVEGKTLKSTISGLKSGEGIPARQALDWTIQIAQGLKAAHDKSIIHRDIKPENIMLTKDEQPKIMDFGIAKLKSGSGFTKTGMSLGTLSYMSPEQAQGVPADLRTDIWSLGVVLYEMLTTDLPFKAEHEAGLQYLIVNEEPPAPSILDRRIPHQIDSVVKKMLTKDRNKRYENMDALIKSLQEVRGDLDKTGSKDKKKALAVLPIENISSDKENEYFGVGLTDELIANLSRLTTIRVVPRTIIMQYRGTTKDAKTIGRELGVRYLLAGSVRKYQDDLRITIELMDIEEEEQVWAGTYKGKLADVFDFQEQVSKQIVEALMVKLTPTEKVVLTKRSTENTEAFDCYLRAREFLYRRTKSSLQFAIQLFQRAIQLDTRYAPAYAGLGEAYAELHYDFDTKEIWIDKAIESSLKALMYDSTVSEAYAALALAYFSKKSLQEAEAAARKAIDLGPNIFTGYWVLARIYHVTNRDAQSLELLQKTIELNPDFHTAYSQLRMAYESLGMNDKVDEIVKLVMEVLPVYLARHPDDARSHNYYAVELVRVGRIEEGKIEAQKAIDLSPDDPLMMYNSACFYSQLGEKKLAIDTLKKSIATGLEDYDWIKNDPDFNNIRNEPEYIELMKGK